MARTATFCKLKLSYPTSLLLSVVLAGALGCQGAGAATLIVSSSGDSGTGSLRQAIANAAAGDTITIAPGISSVTLTAAELIVAKNLTITGPASRVIVQRSAAASIPAFRVFRIGSGVTVSFSNVTISNGRIVGAAGGAGNPVSTNGTAGAAAQGGGIFNGGTLTLRNCTVTGNSVVGGVGGDSFKYSCNNDGNYIYFGTGGTGGSAEGGGVYSNGGLTLVDCTFNGNTATGGLGSRGWRGGSGGIGSGGAIANVNTVTAGNCTLYGNVATGGGGGFGPQAASGGDGIGGAIFNGGTLIPTNCSLSNNSAKGGSSGIGGGGGEALGGAIYHQGFLTVTHCTLSNNTAIGAPSLDFQGAGSGGGLFVSAAASALPSVGGTIIAKNSISASEFSAGPDVGGTVGSRGYNLIGNGTGSTGFGGPGDQVGGLNGNPVLDPTLGPLQNNGGPTPTMALLPGSSAIDKAGSGTPTDQRGLPRPLDDPAIANAVNGSDIGAYERDVVAQGGPNFLVTTTDEHSDGFCGVDCSLWDAANAANANADASIINFKTGLSGTITTRLQAAGIILSSPVTINGPGARTLTISANHGGLVFHINTGVTATIAGLTIANGSGDGVHSGGGIYNLGNLTLLNCALLNNQDGSGGAVASSGALTVTACTFAGNGSSGHGGAVRIVSDNGISATAVITNSTFTGNTSVNSGAITPSGTAALPASLTVTGCTISGNSATVAGSSGGGIFNYHDATITVRDSIIAGNSATNGVDVAGAFTSQGYNLIGAGTGSSGFTASGDQVGFTLAQVKLGPLQNNGGPTDTMALLAGSPALDKGKSFGMTTDQRGQTRPYDDSALPNATGGDGSDIGAFELRTSYAISGRVTDSSSVAIAGVTISRTGSATTAITNSAGYFTFTGITNGTYTLSPSKAGLVFNPANRTVTVNGGDMAGQSFIGG